MTSKRLLIVSSHPDEAISRWVLDNNELGSSIDLIFIDSLLKQFDILDALNDVKATIRWQQGNKIEYTNHSHHLLNRIIYIHDDLFSEFCPGDQSYAKSEFEAYLGFSLNAFQCPQKQAINGICERALSLPQQWRLVKKHTNLVIPEYFWGCENLNLLADRDNVVHSNIYNYYHWSVDEDKNQNVTGFSFIKPKGKPLFVCCIGSSHLITYEDQLTRWQTMQVNRFSQQLRSLFEYFIFELLFFIADQQITFGCINIDIIRSQQHPDFSLFLRRNLLKEYYKCLN